jgi:hypothetical protein
VTNYSLFFDSFGTIPDSRLVKWSKKSGMMRVYNTLQLQGLNSSACGYFCVYVLKQLRAGRNFPDVLSDFTLDTKKNEKLLQRYFSHM